MSFLSSLSQDILQFFLTFVLMPPSAIKEGDLVIDTFIFPLFISLLCTLIAYIIMTCRTTTDKSYLSIVPFTFLIQSCIFIMCQFAIQKMAFRQPHTFFAYLHVLKFALSFIPLLFALVGIFPPLSAIHLGIVAILMTIYVYRTCVETYNKWSSMITCLFYIAIILTINTAFLWLLGCVALYEYFLYEYMVDGLQLCYHIIF